MFIPIDLNVDKIGSLCMSIYVFYTSIRMMVNNVSGILTNDSENNDVKEEISRELEKYDDLIVKSIKVIKMSAYYSIFIQIKLDDNLTIKEFLILEKSIKSHLKLKNRLFRFIDIEPV